ncbi:MAG TPA: M20/M25/M40 family metallo-hydrolase [Vicinamibacterales bacterium]|nr:M20/M25/M40 family metallo-hydrolase [Vicinamibacterales bacterium]
MLRSRSVVFLLAAALVAGAASLIADETIDYATNAKIRKEGRERSQLMRTLHHLTDVYGPRLTGSPNYKAAADWAAKQMTEWGLENAHLEPWDFGRAGWTNERFSGYILSPVKDTLVGEVLAWTPGTKGTVTAQAIRIEPPQCATPAGAGFNPFAAQPARPAAPPEPPKCPTQEELAKYFDSVKAKINGRIVLVGAPAKVNVTLTFSPARMDEDTLRRRFDLDNPAPPYMPPDTPRPRDGQLTAAQINEQVDRFLVQNGVLVRLNDAGREHGQIRAFQNRTYDTTKAVPTVVLRNEDYGRISRILDDGTPVELEFTIVNRDHPEGKTAYNVVAEIPGTDKKTEVVMLGGHLDSWHAATGATDNAIGAATMMEAARILKAIGIAPRRTIRVALWAGEEQGLLGSKAYVKEHFGTFESPKPEFATFNGYFNVDSGTGRIRGASVFGPKSAGQILKEAFAPFEDFGIVGASVTKSRRSGGTDSTSFNEAGLPGIGLGQDPIQYGSYTWHTNLDTYERVIPEDAMRSAIAIAAAVHHVAMRDEMLPRFSKEEMPKPPSEPRPITQ